MLMQRYLGKQLLFSTLVIASAMTMIIWLTQSLKLLDLVINGGAPLQMFGYMLLLTVPKFFEMILPLALAVSIVFLFNKLIADSELIVMQACGLSPWQIGKAVTALGLLLGISVFVISGWLTPRANLELDRMRMVARSGFSVNLLRPGVFNTLGDNIVVYLDKRSSLGRLQGLLIHFTPVGQPSSTVWAKTGGIVMKGDHPIVTMKDGIKQEFNPKTRRVESLRFQSYQVDLSKILNTSISLKLDANQYDLPDLFTKAPTLDNERHRKEFYAEATVRLTRPFLLMSFALSAVTPFLLGRYNRRGHSWRVLQVMLGLIALQVAYLGSTSIAQTHAYGHVLLALVATVPSVVMIMCLLKAHPSGIWRKALASRLGTA